MPGGRVLWLVGNVSLIDKVPHPHTQHTHIHVYLVRQFPLPGGGNVAGCVCATALSVRKQKRRLLSLPFGFSILKFRRSLKRYLPYKGL